MTAPATMIAPVRKTVTVACTPTRAFRVFVEEIGAWWIKSHSIAPSGMAGLTVEPRVGGRWYETGMKGEVCQWGEVKVWDPPGRLVLIWRLSAEFAYDPALHTEVEVTFTPEGAGTRVVLEHRGLEAYGAQAAALRESIDSPRGWGALVESFAGLVAV
ncbi:SRPBCC family protein [Tabrizicola sp.]|uniref:SRPBCC family protein n=1 Tax=Tabrizicola sp. TaxID=2005166 RepID=UPI003F401729